MEVKSLNRRSFLRFALIGAAGTALAACAPKIVKETVVVEKEKVVEKQVTTVVEKEKEVTKVVEKQITSAPAAKAPDKIVFWPEWGGKDADALKVAVDKYTAKSGAPIEYLPVRDHARILASMGAGNPPDLMMTWDSAAVGTWSANGAIRDLTPYIEGNKFDLEKLVPIGVEAGKMLGRQVGLPLSNYLTSIYLWRKAEFKEVGLDPEKAPETFEDLKAYEKKITKIDKNGAIERLGFVPNFGQFGNTVAIRAFGGSLYSADGRAITCDSAEMLEAIEFERYAYKDYGVENIARFREAAVDDASNPADGFYVGKIISEINGEWMPSYFTSVMPSVDYGVGYMPYPQGKPNLKGTMTANSNPMIIPAAAKNPDGGFALIEWLSQADISAEMCLIVGNASPVKEGVAKMIAGTKDAKYKWMLSEVWAKAKVVAMTVTSPVGAIYADVLGREWDLVMALKKEPAEAMAQVKKEIQPELDKALKNMGM